MAVADVGIRNDSDKEIEQQDDDSVDNETIEETEIIKDRTKDLSSKKRVRDFLLEEFKKVEQGFQDQWARSDDQMDYWDIYNCKLGPKQFYVGTSKIFVPAVHDAVNARKTRFTNQIFPQSGRHVDVTSHTGDIPYDIVALIEHYIFLTKLRTKMPAIMRNGDVEGQYNIYVDWTTRKRSTIHKGNELVQLPSGEIDPTQEVESIIKEEVEFGFPDVEVLHDADILVLPQTADSLEDAIEVGGSVTILRRWSKAEIKNKIKQGLITEKAGEALLEAMTAKDSDSKINMPKQMVDAAGIKGLGGSKYAQVYETWLKVKIGKEFQICRAYYGGEERILGCARNPNWSDKINLISCPVEKVSGAFKGQSKVKFCADLQYAINDTINEGLDSAAYSLLPIVMTDPEKNPRIGSMVLNMAAIWQTNPKDTAFAQMPQLWKDAIELAAGLESRIQKNLSVSPAAITQQAPAKNTKKNQAESQMEMAVDILTTADAVVVLEQGLLTPLLQRMIELDHQYRDKAITIRQYGEMGYRASMQDIEPIQWDARYEFKWLGVEAARNAQQIQQQIALLNVLRGIPPQSYPGRKLNIEPILTQIIENGFGPRLAALVWGDATSQLSVDPKTENDMLEQNLPVEVHMSDDDTKHLQAHMQALQEKPTPQLQVHIQKHVQQLQMKRQMMLMQAMGQAQGGQPGVPGGAGPGVAGTPRMGAQPRSPRPQGPPGMIHNDQMRSPGMAPRKT